MKTLYALIAGSILLVGALENPAHSQVAPINAIEVTR